MGEVEMPQPSEAELAILQVLWERGPSTVRAVYERTGRARGTGYTTVLKLMLVVGAWLAGPTHARPDASDTGKAPVHGRVLDLAGKPVAGARVRLYRREG